MIAYTANKEHQSGATTICNCAIGLRAEHSASVPILFCICTGAATADNQIATNAGWNDEMLAAEIATLKEGAFDLDLLGFDDAEIDRLLAGTGDETKDFDEAPEPPAEPSRSAVRAICGSVASIVFSA